MPNHQERRAPLPPGYQHPTHGVDCDCVTCRNRYVIQEIDGVRFALGPDVVSIMRPDAPIRLLEPTADTPWAV